VAEGEGVAAARLSRAATQVVRYKPSAEKRLFGVVCCWRRERSLARAELERSRARGKTPYEYDIAVNQVQAGAQPLFFVRSFPFLSRSKIILESTMNPMFGIAGGAPCYEKVAKGTWFYNETLTRRHHRWPPRRQLASARGPAGPH
jgi:hypothetical protein